MLMLPTTHPGCECGAKTMCCEPCIIWYDVLICLAFAVTVNADHLSPVFCADPHDRTLGFAQQLSDRGDRLMGVLP